MEAHLEKARELGAEAAEQLIYISRSSDRDPAAEVARFGSPLSGNWVDGMTAAELYEIVTGESYPEILTDEIGDVVAAIADVHDEAFAKEAAARLAD